MHMTVTLVRLGDQRFFIASRDVPLGCHLAHDTSLLIRRSMEDVRPVRRNPYPQVSVLPDVRHVRHSPAPFGQSVRKL